MVLVLPDRFEVGRLLGGAERDSNERWVPQQVGALVGREDVLPVLAQSVADLNVRAVGDGEAGVVGAKLCRQRQVLQVVDQVDGRLCDPSRELLDLDAEQLPDVDLGLD